MKIIEVDIATVIPYENNPRKNDAAVSFVATSIKDFGFKQPILVDENKIIITGHTRLKAAQKLGLKKVPILVVSDLTEVQIKAYRIADNKVGELSKWDYDLLKLECDDLVELDFDLTEIGFNLDEIKDIVRGSNFYPVPFDEQPRLSERKLISCPKCKHEFRL